MFHGEITQMILIVLIISLCILLMLNNINCNKMGPLFCHNSGLIITFCGILSYLETKYNEVYQNSLQKKEKREFRIL